MSKPSGNSASTPARVRFAPSPTGDLHVGGVRTALFDWLLARRTGGQFILRIEDTDQDRFDEGSLRSITDSLRWLGLNWDEGPDVGGPHAPYIQSQRLDLYREAAERLIARGYAYECDCTPDRLAQVRERQRAAKLPPGYDGHCRNRPRAELQAARDRGRPVVVRLKVPRTGSVTFRDLIRGPVTFSYATISDFVILKSDGFPTYHLAHIVDDHEMRVTHVLRGEEWIASTPKHVLIHEGLGFEPPELAHLPSVLAPDRSKLSKRHGSTSVLDFRDQGYLPETMFNFLALLGWSPGGDREIMTREEIVAAFSLERVKEAAAIFDRKKLDWMNGMYIRSLDADDLAARMTPFLERADGGLPAFAPRPLDRDRVRRFVPLIRDRLRRLSDAPGLVDLFFEKEISPRAEDIIQRGMDAETTARALEASLRELRAAEVFAPEPLERRFRELTEELGLKTGQLFGSIRVAVTGRKVAPPLFDTIVVLGKELSETRLENAIRTLTAASATA